MPSQNATDVYRLTSGFAPCAVDQLDCTLFQPSNANLIYYPSHLISGDMAVNPGTDDGILSGDTWWFPQVSRGLPTSKHPMAVTFQDSGLKWYLLLNSQSMVVPETPKREHYNLLWECHKILW